MIDPSLKAGKTSVERCCWELFRFGTLWTHGQVMNSQQVFFSCCSSGADGDYQNKGKKTYISTPIINSELCSRTLGWLPPCCLVWYVERLLVAVIQGVEHPIARHRTWRKILGRRPRRCFFHVRFVSRMHVLRTLTNPNKDLQLIKDRKRKNNAPCYLCHVACPLYKPQPGLLFVEQRRSRRIIIHLYKPEASPFLPSSSLFFPLLQSEKHHTQKR